MARERNLQTFVNSVLFLLIITLLNRLVYHLKIIADFSFTEYHLLPSLFYVKQYLAWPPGIILSCVNALALIVVIYELIYSGKKSLAHNSLAPQEPLVSINAASKQKISKKIYFKKKSISNYKKKIR